MIFTTTLLALILSPLAIAVGHSKDLPRCSPKDTKAQRDQVYAKLRLAKARALEAKKGKNALQNTQSNIILHEIKFIMVMCKSPGNAINKGNRPDYTKKGAKPRTKRNNKKKRVLRKKNQNKK